MAEPLTFDDIKIGQRWVSPGRTVTETDVVNFANLTGDCDPLHIDHVKAAQSPFGQPIAHGLLGICWVAGLAIQTPAMQTLAFTSIRNWEFSAPIFFGDTVHVESLVKEKFSSGRKSGKVIWEKKLINQDGRVVQQGIFETLVRRGQLIPKPHLSQAKTSSES